MSKTLPHQRRSLLLRVTASLFIVCLLTGCSSLEKYRPPIENFSTRTTELTEEFNLAMTGTNEAFRRHEYGQLRGPHSDFPLNSFKTVDQSRKAKEITAWENRNPDPDNREKREPIIKKHPVPEEVQRGLGAALLELASLSKVLGDLAANNSSDAHFSAQIESVSSFLAAAGEVITAYNKNLFVKEGLRDQFTTLGSRFSALSGLLKEVADKIANGKRKRAIKYAGEKALPEVEAMIEPLAVILAELTALEKEYLVARRNDLADLLRKDGKARNAEHKARLALKQKLDFQTFFKSLTAEEVKSLLQLLDNDKTLLPALAQNPSFEDFVQGLNPLEEEALFQLLEVRPQFNYAELQALTGELELMNTKIRELDDVRRPLRRAIIEKFAEAIDGLKKVTGHGEYKIPQNVIPLLDNIHDEKVKIPPPRPSTNGDNNSGGDNNG